MSNIYRVIIIILLVYIAWVNHVYVQVGWCESEIEILRFQIDDIHTTLTTQ
jgi:hypothetical protein